MRLIKPSYEILGDKTGREVLKHLEAAGRTCYKSEEKITDDSCYEFIKMLIKRGHESVLEHSNLSVRFICDRGVSHEIVRHRLASFSQESTRYVTYNGEMEFIIPPWVSILNGEYPNTPDKLIDTMKMILRDKQSFVWFTAMQLSANAYTTLIEKGWKPEEARSVLPNSLKTEIVVTADMREWRLIMKQRTSNAAHVQMRELMRPLLEELKAKFTVLFDDISY